MVKKKTAKDTAFVLKMVLYLIIGAQWIFLTHDTGFDHSSSIPIPAGLLIGLVFASFEHFRIDRKLEYVTLILSSFMGYWLAVGLFVKILK